MNNWQAAADDAAKAITESKATPYSIAEASVPAFANSDDHNCMWAIYIQEVEPCSDFRYRQLAFTHGFVQQQRLLLSRSMALY